ncbi:hypothetical protein Tco_0209868 [Tanacetum coccineum]
MCLLDTTHHHPAAAADTAVDTMVAEGTSDNTGHTVAEHNQAGVYGYMKNQKKTVKNGQTQTQEWKSEQKPEAKTRKTIIEQRVKVNQKAHILELKRRNHKDYCSDNLYAVSIKEDMMYLFPELHSASTKEDPYDVSR